MIEKKMESLPLKSTRIHDGFWSKYIELVSKVDIPYQWDILNDRVNDTDLPLKGRKDLQGNFSSCKAGEESGLSLTDDEKATGRKINCKDVHSVVGDQYDVAASHCIRNFEIAAGLKKGKFEGAVCQDTDLAKWLEAAAYSLESKPDQALEQIIDNVVGLIGKAQQPDGYINTYFTIEQPDGRWTNLMEGHELYTAGHFIEAAVAYYQATGKNEFLNIMCKFADYIDTIFGPEEHKLKGYPGHQEIELALVKLYRVTNESRYLRLAGYFIDQRGQKPYYFDEERKRLKYQYIMPEFAKFDKKYNQTHLPVREQTTADGHAVRATYMYSAMADLAYENHDDALLKVCKNIYDNIVYRRMYITGGIGSAEFGERFTCDYDLPNDTNYSESCASIGLVMFANRMLQITRDGKYADTMETALYNNVLAGISFDGMRFFYVNPLEVWPESCENSTSKTHVKAERQKWFSCACCPPNIVRTLASLGQYIYGVADDGVYISLFVSSNTSFKVNDAMVHLAQQTGYPYENTVRITAGCEKKSNFTVSVRNPGWSKRTKIKINGEKADVSVLLKDGFIHINRQWGKNDVIDVKFDMPPRLVFANPKVRADAGRVAVMKGPLVYCLEECDNGDNLSAVEIDADCEIKERFEKELLGGTLTLKCAGKKLVEEGWNNKLYSEKKPSKQDVSLTAIPYCLWSNRGKGEMIVWLRTR